MSKTYRRLTWGRGRPPMPEWWKRFAGYARWAGYYDRPQLVRAGADVFIFEISRFDQPELADYLVPDGAGGLRLMRKLDNADPIAQVCIVLSRTRVAVRLLDQMFLHYRCYRTSDFALL